MTSRKILIPVDGSPNALRALQFAGRRYRNDANVCLLLLYVQAPLPSSRHVPRAMIAEHHARMAEAALKPARALVEKLNLTADCYTRTGEAGATIAEFARKTGCSEIVMGTRGLGRVSGLFLGSVAMKVIHLASVPVTLVK